MPCDLPESQMSFDFGQDHALVKPSHRQENKEDSKMKDISGQSSQNLLTSVGLQSYLESRLKRQLNTDGSILFKMTWKAMATPAHRPYCLLRALVRRTSDTGCTGGGCLANACELGTQRQSNLERQRTELSTGLCDQGDGDAESVRLERETVIGLSDKKEGWETERRPTCESSAFNQQLENPDSFGCRGRYSQGRLRTSIEGLPFNIEEQLFGHFNFWRGAEWRIGQDGKIRPVEPGTFPLAYGVPARVGRLRGYGNAIVPQVASEFIKAFITVAQTDHK